MEKIKKSNISNFFIEVIIVILFFSIASVIIVKIFATSSYNNDINNVRTKAIINANSLIEVYKDNSLEKCIKTVINGYKIENDVDYKNENIIFKINKDMKYDKNGDINLSIAEKVETTKAGEIKTISLKYIYKNTEIYVIEGKKYEEK